MITTYSGKTVDPFAIRPEDIELEDIAHALSMTCRFGGHCRSFYSVAEHSVLVAARCPPEVRLDGLLHDAAEAYLGDLPGPLKRKFPAFEKAELDLYRNVADRFGLEFPIPDPVRKADEAMLGAELSALFSGNVGSHDATSSIRCLPPPEAKELFLSTYRAITASQPRGASPNRPIGRSPPVLPLEGAVLGVDVGWSERQRSSAACLLSWTESSFDIQCQRFTARPDDLRNGLTQVLAGSTVLTAAIDGPLRGQLDEIGVYRAAECVLTRRLAKHIGKPGQSSSPNGRKLNCAANVVANLLLEQGAVGPTGHQAGIHERAVVEAFPTSFLGVVLDVGFRKKGQQRSDSYYEMLTHGADDGRLGVLLRSLLPDRAYGTALSSLTNHDDRAALVCALTALCVAARCYVAVGDEAGFIILPPRERADRPGLKDWAWSLMQQNLAECRSAKCTVESGSSD